MASFTYDGVKLGRGFDRVPTDKDTIKKGFDVLLRDATSKKVYFAHPQPLYGSEQEKADINAIVRGLPGFSVVNPGDLGEIKIRDMGFYLDVVKACDALVYVRLNGKVLGGVGLETEFAFNSGKAVYELSDGRLTLIQSVPEYLNREETVALLKEVGFRK